MLLEQAWAWSQDKSVTTGDVSIIAYAQKMVTLVVHFGSDPNCAGGDGKNFTSTGGLDKAYLRLARFNKLSASKGNHLRKYAIASIRSRARISGALYVLCIACGFFAEMVVRAKLVVYSDPATTAQNILGSPSLYRWGFFADMSALVSGVLSSVVLYSVFKVVSRSIALAVLVLDIISNTISLSGGILLFAPLSILPADDALSVFSTAQLQWLSMLSLKLYESAYALNLGIFSGSCILTGFLIYRSTFLPKALGVLMGIAGVCYLTNSFVNLMPKGFGSSLFPWIFLPVLLGEGAMALWLLIVGLDPEKWNAVARATAGRPL